jgi:hypothetical protein
MESDALRPAFLISNLVFRLSAPPGAGLPIASDIFNRFPRHPPDYDPSVFLFRWMSDLQSEGKSCDIKLVQRDANYLTRHLTLPGPLFLLLDNLRMRPPCSSLVHPPSVPQLLPQSVSSLPADFLCVLRGLDGDSFRWSSGRRRFVCRSLLQPDMLHVAQRVSAVGSMVRSLRHFIDSREGLAHQYVAGFVSALLDSHSLVVAALDGALQTMSARQMSCFLTSAHFVEMKAVTIVCHTVGKAKGGVLYNQLELASKHGDPVIQKVAATMKGKCFEFIASLIRDWVTKGEVDDPFAEFFVRGDPAVILCSKWWNERYSIVREELPANLSEEQSSLIFSGGKALNFLRQWDLPIVLDIDPRLSLDDFVTRASAESRSRLLDLMNRDNLLMKSVKDIHNFVLLQRGDFATAFMELEEDSIPKRMERIIQKFAGHLVQEVDFEVSSTDCQFAYRAIPPISAILGQTELSAYKLVSGLLLKLNRVEFNLTRARKHSADRPWLILLNEVLEIVKLIRDFLNLHVVRRSYQKFLNVCEKAQDFDTILKAHNEHIVTITRGCWMTESGRECRRALYQLLLRIETSARSEHNIAQNRAIVHEHFRVFFEVIQNHQVTRRELGRPLVRTFGYILNS